MARYKVQGPDGQIHIFEGPEGATPSEIEEFAGQAFGGKTAPQANPTDGMSTFDRVAAGFGKAITDTGRGLGQMVGLVSRKDVEESRKLDKALMDTGAGTAGNVLGNLTIAAPAAFIPGAQGVAGAAGLGAFMGLAQPSTSTNETLKNIAIGGATSAALPALMTAGKVAKSFVEPLYEGGRNQILGRALMSASGGESAKALTNLRQAAELVPGSLPTAGQAAGVPSIAALQRAAMAGQPNATNQLAARLSAQNEARIAALQSAAPNREASVLARTKATEPLYKQAYGETITQTPEIAALMGRPSMSGALGRGGKLAEEQGASLTVMPGAPAQPSAILGANGLPMSVTPATAGTMTGRDAHLIKMGLDDMANAAPMTGIGGNELRAIQGTRGDFLSEIEKQVPSYGQARSTYADLSRPINQSDIVQEIGKQATNFRGNLTPAAYARALRDETAQAVTGQPTATLAKSMEPGQLQKLNAIKEDLLRADFADTAGRGVGSDTVQKLAYTNILDQAGIPTMVRNFGPAGAVGNLLQRGGQIAYKDANEKLAAQLAEALLDPSQTARLMESSMVTPQMQAIINGLKRGSTALGGATAGSIQALQQ